MRATDQTTVDRIALEKLSADCPIHGTVPVVCPRCAGKRGGKRHKGTTWKRKKLHNMETARRLLDILPEARMFEEMAAERKEFQELAERMELTKDERELAFTKMHLSQGMNYAKHICDRMGMSAEKRAKLRQDMQEMVAVAFKSK